MYFEANRHLQDVLQGKAGGDQRGGGAVAAPAPVYHQLPRALRSGRPPVHHHRIRREGGPVPCHPQAEAVQPAFPRDPCAPLVHANFAGTEAHARPAHPPPRPKDTKCVSSRTRRWDCQSGRFRHCTSASTHAGLRAHSDRHTVLLVAGNLPGAAVRLQVRCLVPWLLPLRTRHAAARLRCGLDARPRAEDLAGCAAAGSTRFFSRDAIARPALAHEGPAQATIDIRGAAAAGHPGRDPAAAPGLRAAGVHGRREGAKQRRHTAALCNAAPDCAGCSAALGHCREAPRRDGRRWAWQAGSRKGILHKQRQGAPKRYPA
mmetsp:Transcript_31200/g.87891  ORF Transcript_31200/g.87891 Transcript_31200/m.87891 type:complete len:318 (-) Transcript_31200:414-1367(-)